MSLLDHIINDIHAYITSNEINRVGYLNYSDPQEYNINFDNMEEEIHRFIINFDSVRQIHFYERIESENICSSRLAIIFFLGNSSIELMRICGPAFTDITINITNDSLYYTAPHEPCVFLKPYNNLQELYTQAFDTFVAHKKEEIILDIKRCFDTIPMFESMNYILFGSETCENDIIIEI